MRRFPWLFASALVMTVFSGCLTEPEEPGLDGAASEGDPSGGTAVRDIPLAGKDCTLGGGHSVHPIMLNPLPAPWWPADILDDVGPQLVYSEVPDPFRPVPEKGNTMGNFHATMRCASWMFDGEPRPDLLFGFVGMRVETPEFSDDAPTHDYLVTVIATNDDDLYGLVHDAGIHPMRATGSIEHGAADSVRVQMRTDHNGAYDSLFKLKPLGENHATHVRLWFQHENADGTFTPVALDMRTSGGDHFGADGQSYFSHLENHHHEPLPGAAGQTAAVLYSGFDATFAWGPTPDTRIPQAYEH